jgi:Predicted membrane protein (DUF2085)
MNWALARRGLVTAELLWTAALLGVAYAVSHARGSSLVAAFSAAGYAVGSLICHQRPDRSFHLWGAQLPVCARCTGVYVGAALAGIAPALRRVSAGSRLRGRRVRPMLLLTAFATPALLTLVFEWTTGITPSNTTRAATGVLVGWAVMAILLEELEGD